MGDQSKHDKDKIYLQIHKELINVFAPFWDANPKPGDVIHHHLNQLQMWINGTKITVPGY